MTHPIEHTDRIGAVQRGVHSEMVPGSGKPLSEYFYAALHGNEKELAYSAH